MDNRDIDNIAADGELYSLESILAEYKAEAALEAEDSALSAPAVDRARSIMLEIIDDQLAAASISSDDADAGSAVPAEDPEPETSPAEPAAVSDTAACPAEPDTSVGAEDSSADDSDISESDIDDEISAAMIIADIDGSLDDADYASPGEYPEPDDTAEDDAERRRAESSRTKGLGERLMAPVLAILAAVAVRKRASGADSVRPLPPDGAPASEAEPETPPKKAGAHYSKRIRLLHTRGVIAAAMCVVLAYIAYSPQLNLPMAGVLGSSVRAAAGVCLVLELAVVICGLDIFTTGILNLISGSPGAETLVSLSCIFSALDALVIALGRTEFGLPYCAVSAISMAFAIRGSRLSCIAMSSSLRVAAVTKNPFSVTSERGIADKGTALLKSQRGLDGFVRRCEAPDFNEAAYEAVAPFVVILSVILSVLSGIKLKSFAAFVHIFSSMLAAGATFSALLNFAKPYATVARQLLLSGAAIAGWPGCADIGASRSVIVTDTDLFPSGTVSGAGIRIIEGNFADKVVSYTGSLLAASGSGVSSVFTDLIYKYGYTLLRVEDFNVHEGGGLTAMIGSDRVLVGSSGFMNLMGVRLPQKLISKTAIFTAINGDLAGVFNINYTPVTSVQDALVALLHGRGEPLFAVRDFNITPLMIRQKFKMPTESFNFPSYADRYRISAAQPGESSQIVAVLSRQGLGPLAGATDKGRRLYSASRLCTVLSILGAFAGIVMMFLLNRSGDFDPNTLSNTLSFMFLWLVPLAVVDFGLRR